MKSLSFKVIGDGNEYNACFVTVDTIDEGDHWLYTFPTLKDEIITVTVNIPDLIRRNWSGKGVEFIQNNFLYFQIHAVNPGPYDLKFWDIRIFQNS